MIQRIQTIFLLLASGASLGLFGLPFASATDSAQTELLADGAFALNDHVGLMAAFAVAGALSLIAIFLFKNRGLQIKISRVSLFFIVAGIIFAAYLLFIKASIPINSLSLGLGTFLPLAGIILTILANRYIKKDENLVQSMDRLR